MKKEKEKSEKSKLIKVMVTVLIIIVLLLSSYLVYSKIIKNSNDEIESITYTDCEKTKTIKDLKTMKKIADIFSTKKLSNETSLGGTCSADIALEYKNGKIEKFIIQSNNLIVCSDGNLYEVTLKETSFADYVYSVFE